MVKELVHDPIFLGQKSELADESDTQTARDLLDTVTAHRETCVGMAANMIGVKKRVIVFDNNGVFEIMYNPEIVKRYKSIKVKYQNAGFQERFKTFTGFTAQVIQHEIDHCNGILI